MFVEVFVEVICISNEGFKNSGKDGGNLHAFVKSSIGIAHPYKTCNLFPKD